VLGFEITHKGFDKLDELSRRLIVPLKDAATTLAAAIRRRVQMGISPTGGRWTPLGEYSTTGRSKDEANRWWVAPGQPQPAGYMYRVGEGKWQGWVVYENYDRYLDLQPGGRRRDWSKSGSLWASLGVRAMAVNRVKISFYGTRGRGKAAQAQVAYLAGRNETANVLMYNEPERAALVEAIKADIDDEMAKRIGQVGEAGRIQSRVRGANRRASRLLGG
jgi:hypothetical protein